MSFISGMIAGLLLVAGAIWLQQRRNGARRSSDGLSDAQIRAIEREGTVEVEEPLDLDRIREEETRFWEESWDEPDEW